MPQIKHLQEILAQNAELTARVKLSDEQLRKLQQEQEQFERLKEEHQHLTERVMLLQEEVRWYKEQFFGRSSQKSPAEMSAEQKLLFNEAEVLAAIEAADAAQAARTTKIAAHERRTHSGGREAIPEHLPRKEIVHDLPNAQKYCEHEGVCWAMERIGEECSERYHYEPPKMWVERQVRPKWSCSHCHQGVRITSCPPHILPKSNASASLLAYLITSKFIDGMPLYRVCQQLARQEVRLSPGTVGSWVNAVGEAVLPLINLMQEELLSAPFVQMDESVPRTQGRGALRCCGEDEGWVPRGRLSEGDLKPPTAAVSKRHGGERVGKAAARPRQVRIKEMSVSEPLVDVSKIARCCRNQCHFVPLG